jgi:hypothetical protein
MTVVMKREWMRSSWFRMRSIHISGNGSTSSAYRLHTLSAVVHIIAIVALHHDHRVTAILLTEAASGAPAVSIMRVVVVSVELDKAICQKGVRTLC